jgi:hypothetical protein
MRMFAFWRLLIECRLLNANLSLPAFNRAYSQQPRNEYDMTHDVPKVAAQLDRLKIICERVQREGEPSPKDQETILKQDMSHFLYEYNYQEVQTDNYHSPEKLVTPYPSPLRSYSEILSTL